MPREQFCVSQIQVRSHSHRSKRLCRRFAGHRCSCHHSIPRSRSRGNRLINVCEQAKRLALRHDQLRLTSCRLLAGNHQYSRWALYAAKAPISVRWHMIWVSEWVMALISPGWYAHAAARLRWRKVFRLSDWQKPKSEERLPNISSHLIAHYNSIQLFTSMRVQLSAYCMAMRFVTINYRHNQ